MPEPVWTEPIELTRLWAEMDDDGRFEHLRDQPARLVPGAGTWEGPPVAFVGEAPGRQEDEQGQPFVGMSGQFLFRHVIELTGLTRENVWTTNIVKYRPPDNRTPWPAELMAGAQYLRRELAFVRPRVIVTLGSAPLSVMVPKTQISKVHGHSFVLASGRLLVPMFHPAYILRRRDLLPEFRDDLGTLSELLEDTRGR